LQPGSVVTGQGFGSSLLAENLSILETTQLQSSSVVSETRSESQKHLQFSTPAAAQSDTSLISASPAAIARSEPFTFSSQNLVDTLRPTWMNDDLALLVASSSRSSVAALAPQEPASSAKLTASPAMSVGVIESPIGVAAPPTPQPSPGSNPNASAVTAAPLPPTQLPMPATTSITSSVHAANLHAAPLNLPSSPVSGGINTHATMQNFSTYVGGSGEDGLTAVAVDSANIYVAGYLETSPGTIEVLVASIDHTGSTLNWAQSIPGGIGPRDEAHGIAVSADGASLYIAGSISEPNGVSPTDGFVAQLDITNGTILNSLDLGSGDAEGVAVDSNGNVFVSGYSMDPGTGAKSIMTAEFDPFLVAPVYATTFQLQNGNGDNVQSFVHGSQSIAVDPATDNTYIIGTVTDAGGTDNSPVVVAYNGTNGMLWAPVNYPNPTFGGAGGGGAIVFQAGGLYITGTLFDSNGGTMLSSDLFVARLDASGNQVTNYQWVVMDSNGNRDGDWTGNGLVVNANNEPILTGAALDPDGSSMFAPTNGVDVHVTHFGPNGNVTQGGTGRPENTFGGSDMDVGNAVILDPSNPGSVLVVGTTHSNDFPTTSNAMQQTYGGGLSDGFLVSVQV
jgi:hypothetical protein